MATEKTAKEVIAEKIAAKPAGYFVSRSDDGEPLLDHAGNPVVAPEHGGPATIGGLSPEEYFKQNAGPVNPLSNVDNPVSTNESRRTIYPDNNTRATVNPADAVRVVDNSRIEVDPNTGARYSVDPATGVRTMIDPATGRYADEPSAPVRTTVIDNR